MTLKREIKDAYIEGGASIYVKTHSNAVYVDENETETLTQILDNVKDSIIEHTTQLNNNVNNLENVKNDISTNYAKKSDVNNLASNKAEKTDLDNIRSTVNDLDSKKANKTDLTTPFNFKGNCLSTALPTGANVNDTWYCTDLKYRMTWNGTSWFQSSLSEGDYHDELLDIKTDLNSQMFSIDLSNRFGRNGSIFTPSATVNQLYIIDCGYIEKNTLLTIDRTIAQDYSIGVITISYPLSALKQNPTNAVYLKNTDEKYFIQNSGRICIQVNSNSADIPLSREKALSCFKLYTPYFIIRKINECNDKILRNIYKGNFVSSNELNSINASYSIDKNIINITRKDNSSYYSYITFEKTKIEFENLTDITNLGFIFSSQERQINYCTPSTGKVYFRGDYKNELNMEILYIPQNTAPFNLIVEIIDKKVEFTAYNSYFSASAEYNFASIDSTMIGNTNVGVILLPFTLNQTLSNNIQIKGLDGISTDINNDMSLSSNLLLVNSYMSKNNGKMIIQRKNNTKYHYCIGVPEYDTITFLVKDNNTSILLASDGVTHYYWSTNQLKGFIRGAKTFDGEKKNLDYALTDEYYVKAERRAKSIYITYFDTSWNKLSETINVDSEYFNVSDSLFVPNICLGMMAPKFDLNKQLSFEFSPLELQNEAFNDVSNIYATRFKEEEEALYKKVRENVDNNTIVFSIATDTHYSEKKWANSLPIASIVGKISSNVGVDFMAHLGDMIYEGADDGGDTCDSLRRIQQFVSNSTNNSIPFVYALGHHEMYPYNWDTGNYALDYRKVMGLCGKYNRHLNFIHDNNDCANYYFDIKNLRVIVVDSTYKCWGFTKSTIEWVKTSLNTNNKVIFLSHSTVNRLSHPDNGEVYNGVDMENAIKEFTDKGGQVLGWFHGHTHWDNIYKQNDIKYPYISINATGPFSMIDYTQHYCSGGNPTSYLRTVREYSGYSFDIVCVHLDTGVVNMFRFGAGSDRIYTPQ